MSITMPRTSVRKTASPSRSSVRGRRGSRFAAKNASAAEREAFAELAAEFTEAARTNDDISFIRLDREFNELCLTAARNEFAEGAMRLMHGLSRRFWYVHYKQTADLPETA